MVMMSAPVEGVGCRVGKAVGCVSWESQQFRREELCRACPSAPAPTCRDVLPVHVLHRLGRHHVGQRSGEEERVKRQPRNQIFHAPFQQVAAAAVEEQNT